MTDPSPLHDPTFRAYCGPFESNIANTLFGVLEGLTFAAAVILITLAVVLR
jgi:hypothetical protein